MAEYRAVITAVPGARWHALALLSLAIVTWFGVGAFVIGTLDRNARTLLAHDAQARASLAAIRLEQKINDFIRSSRADDAKSDGIQFRSRDSALQLISSSHLATPDAGGLDDAAQSAAKTALMTETPQASAYRNASEHDQSGIDLWLPLQKSGDAAALTQVHIPGPSLNHAMKGLSDASWTMTVTNANGDVLASRRTIDDPSAAQGTRIAGNVIEGASAIAPLGIEVRAAAPLGPLEDSNLRNWVCFLLVTGLMAATMVAFKPSLNGPVTHKSDVPTGRSKPSPIPRDWRRSAAPNSRPRAEAATESHSPPALDDSVDGRLRMALEAGGMCAWEWHYPAGTMHWNTACASLLKEAPGGSTELTTRELLRRILPHERRRLLHLVRAGLTDGRPLNIDARIERFDGEVRWFAIRGQPLLDHAGRFSGFTGVAHDITAQKQNLSRTDSLLREVSHRSKNMLALILAMARLTARDAVDVKAHLKQFALRVAGLAASQDLIVAADWENVDFGTLAAAELEAVARSEATRVKISGPPVLLTPEAAQTLGMILTELTLNAVAHGALSVATGDVELSWHVTENGRITICWREIGGPPYDAARPKGYGISVVERFSTQGLKFDAGASVEPDGFTWSLTGPLGNIGSLPSNVVRETRA
jgi:two-component sensor histidine kinase